MNAIRFKTVTYNGIIRLPDEVSDKEVEVVLLRKKIPQNARNAFWLW